MAWRRIPPGAFVSGEVITAEMLNVQIRANVDAFRTGLEHAERKIAELAKPVESKSAGGVLAAVAVAAAASASQKPVTRRQLFGFGWLRRK